MRPFSPDDEVFFCRGSLGGNYGNYAEYAIAQKQDALLKPARISLAEAAAALVMLPTWEALYDLAHLAPNSDCSFTLALAA